MGAAMVLSMRLVGSTQEPSKQGSYVPYQGGCVRPWVNDSGSITIFGAFLFRPKGLMVFSPG